MTMKLAEEPQGNPWIHASNKKSDLLYMWTWDARTRKLEIEFFLWLYSKKKSQLADIFYFGTVKIDMKECFPERQRWLPKTYDLKKPDQLITVKFTLRKDKMEFNGKLPPHSAGGQLHEYNHGY
ncbi:hypothetical protein MMC09_001385 [Bachmanniomyces sp. S44760]|nr:hypothetical protein [Bachmanniomyces sp. S44760]